MIKRIAVSKKHAEALERSGARPPGYVATLQAHCSYPLKCLDPKWRDRLKYHPDDHYYIRSDDYAMIHRKYAATEEAEEEGI